MNVAYRRDRRLAAPLAERVRGRDSRRRSTCSIGVLLAAGVLGFALSASMATGQATRSAGADTVQQVSSLGTTPTTAPASAGQQLGRTGGSVEDQPIRRSGDAEARVGENATAARRDGAGRPVAATPASPSSPLDLQRVALALGAVVGLIFLLHWLARKLFPSVAAGRSSQAVRVLSRSVLAPKQQVLLLKIGRRVIVVGDSGSQMNALAEITDADEIALLIGALEAEKRPVASAFGGFFRKARKGFDAADDSEKLLDPAAATHDDDREADEADDSEIDDQIVPREAPPAELGLAEAHGELRGLMDKVKELSQQFRRS